MAPTQPAPLGVGGLSLSKLKSVEDLTKKVESLKSGRSALERQWRLNLAFYKGNQYSYYVPGTSRLESLITDDGIKPRHRIRIVSNQIMPGAHTLLAQLTKTKPRLYATPGGNAQNDVRAAQMCQALLEHWWRDMNLDEKLDEAILWSIIASAGYWQLTWDPFAAKQMRFLLAPDGSLITDENIKTAVRAEFASSGVEPREKIVYMGDIRVDVVSPFDVFLDDSVKTFEDSKFVFVRHALDPDEIKSRWGKDVVPDVTPATPDVNLPFQRQNGNRGAELTLRNVFIGYFKPSASIPDGRVVVFTEGGDKQILSDEKWPFPHHHLPLVKFAGMRVPGSVYDDSVVTHSIPIQKELNRTVSQIVEYKNLTVNPQMTAPRGSMTTRRTTEPGLVLEYSPIPVGGGIAKPEWQTMPTLPPYVFEHLNYISQRLQETFLSPEVVQGKVPPNVEAGVAIDLLQEMATDKLAPIIKLIETSLARAGQQMLTLAQKFYIEARTMHIRGTGGSVQSRQFYNADIAGDITVHAETGSGLPRTRAGRQARIERMVQMGMLDPRQAMKELDLADMGSIMSALEADEAFAYRNIDKLLAGAPINPEAKAQAEQAVMAGMNPQTQLPFRSPQEVDQFVQEAALTPLPGIDYDTHLYVTGMFIKGIEFETLSPPVRQAFFTYYNNLIQAKFSIPPMPQAEAPKTSLQIKSTAGPSATAKILQKSGVQVTPDEMSEPPLETWVTDSVDKPDTDSAGPGQEANNLSQAAKTLVAASAADAASKQAALQKQVSHQQQVEQSDQSHQMDMAIKAEKHQAELRRMHADAATAEKKTKESSFKPQPKAQPKKKAA